MHAGPRTIIASVLLSTCILLAAGCRDDMPRDERPEPQTASDAGPSMPGSAASSSGMASDAAPGDRRLPEAAVDNDREFLRTALAGGLAEVSISRDVETRSPTPEVRALAKRIADDHEALNAKLRAVAGDLGTVEMDASARAMETLIRSSAVPALDRRYLQHMAESHAMSIVRYEAAAANAADAGVRALAAEALPRLREHARAVETRMAQGK